jgi:hypothetical protein
MARKSNVQLLQEALESGDIAKAQALAKKIKVDTKPAAKKAKKGKTKIIYLPSEAEAEVVEQPIAKPQTSGTIRRIPANTGESDPRKGGARRVMSGASGERQMSVAPLVARRMDGWKDTGADDKNDSVKTNKNLGVQRITERNRPPAEMVEAECDTCREWFIIPESHVKMRVGNNWRCSKCCKRGS